MDKPWGGMYEASVYKPLKFSNAQFIHELMLLYVPIVPRAVCDAQYRIIAWTMNCPGSQNDRTAFKVSGFPKLLEKLPEGYFIVGDAAYPASDCILVPFPGTTLSVSQDAYNFYQSQCRMAIEQTFGIMVSFAGVTPGVSLNRPPRLEITGCRIRYRGP